MEILESSVDTRNLHAGLFSDSRSDIGDRWAIIIGISKYENDTLNLKYAHRDAEELYNLIRTPSGGGFEASHIVKLIDEEATTANITRALRSFLKRPAKNDLVLIYFACHGAPDLDRPDTVYLLTYDTDPDDISGTALPMREIDISLTENLLAERVVIIADACHSASIGKGIGRRTSVNSSAVVNRYLQNVSKSKGGLALLTSAEANEVAHEDEKWGGGHGVFTYFLLEGMHGNADMPPEDGIVSVGELFEYVRRNVQKATGDKQHPAIGTTPFDRSLPLAITGGITAQGYYHLGYQLYHLGLLLNDKYLFYAASRELNEALHLAKLESNYYPDASDLMGLTLIMAGEYNKAISALEKFTQDDNTQAPAILLLYLGIAQTKNRNYEAGIGTFKKFLGKDPNNENADWIKDYIEFLEDTKDRKKYALLIGISNPIQEYFQTLPGAINDINSMKEILTEKFGFDYITILADSYATRESILNQLEHLIDHTTTNDTVLIYYSGHAAQDNTSFLIPYDTIVEVDSGENKIRRLKNSISGEELHMLANRLSASNTTLIIDSMPNSEFLNLARKDANYTLILGASPGQTATDDASHGQGFFTYNFIKKILSSDLVMKPTYGEIIDYFPNKAANNQVEIQTPVLVGNKEDVLFMHEHYYSRLFDFVQLKMFQSLKASQLEERYRLFRKKVAIRFPRAYYTFGQAFLEKGKYQEALEALQFANTERTVQGANADIIFTLFITQTLLHNYRAAISSLKKYNQLNLQNSDTITEAIKKLKLLLSGQKHAVLIGISNYTHTDIPNVEGAVNDATALKKALIEKFRFKEENIILLLEGQATHKAISESFDQLTRDAERGPAFFYFSGNGSFDDHGFPTIISADGRQNEVYDIDLRDLSSLTVGKKLNLITVIDAGWTANGNRTIPYDTRKTINTRNIAVSRDFSDSYNSSLKIGLVSVYSYSIYKQLIFPPSPNSDSEFQSFEDNNKKAFYGSLTHRLIETIIKSDNAANMSYSQLIQSISNIHPKIVGDNLDAKIFSNLVLEYEVIESITKGDRHQLIDNTIFAIKKLIEQRNNIYPEGYLNLGIAFGAKGDYGKGIEAIETALAQKNYNYPDANYYLGKLLFESGNDFGRAVGLLRQTIQQQPDNIRAYYYLGQSIRSVIEKETIVEANRVLRTYLENGSPIGHEDELLKFLKPIEDKEQRIGLNAR